MRLCQAALAARATSARSRHAMRGSSKWGRERFRRESRRGIAVALNRWRRALHLQRAAVDASGQQRVGEPVVVGEPIVDVSRNPDERAVIWQGHDW